MRPPIVYIMNKSSHDFSGASEYGRFVFLTDTQVNRFATTNMYRHLTYKLKNSLEHDYLLVTSLTTLNMVTACIFVQRHKRLNLLIYRMKDNSYVKRVLIFN